MAYFADISDSGLPPHWDMAKSLLANCTTILLSADKGGVLVVALVVAVWLLIHGADWLASLPAAGCHADVSSSWCATVSCCSLIVAVSSSYVCCCVLL